MATLIPVLRSIILSSLLGLFLTQAGRAQISGALPDSSGRLSVELSYQLGLESNAFNNGFAMSFVNGSRLDSLQIRDISANLPAIGLAAFYSRAHARSFWTSSTRKATGRGFYGGFDNLEISEIRFRPALFNLVFIGNGEYAGQNLTLDGMRYRQISTQSAHFGWYKIRHDSTDSRWIIGMHLNLMKGQYLHELSLHNGSAYTAEGGDEIRLILNYDYSRSDTQYTRFTDLNAIGMGLGFIADYRQKNGLSFRAELSNLGAMRWVNNRHNFHKDSTIQFKGWEIENILNIPSTAFDNADTDSLSAILSGETSKQSFWAMHPCLLQFRMQIPFRVDWVNLSLYAEQMFFTSSMPYLSIGPEFRLASGKFLIQPYISNGGYGSQNAGLRMEASIGDNLSLQAGCHAIDALLFPATRMGQSLYLSASYRFKPKAK
jgi:hypothetical protein